MLDFDSARDPVTPKDASTVVALRERGGRLEVFCVKRHGKSGFLGGAVVFPGGKVAPEDQSLDWTPMTNGLAARSDAFAEAPLVFAVAALRELFEEAALMPTVGRTLSDAEVTSLRARVTAAPDPTRAFHELLSTEQLMLDTARLVPFSRWVTPRAEQRRYDTRFYLLPLTEAQRGVHDDHETTQSFWASPADVLARWERDELFLAPPTSHTLNVLAALAGLEAALELAQHTDLSEVCPHFCMVEQQMVLALPGDPLFPEAAPPPADPSAPTRFVMEGSRFVPRRIVD
ncbi:MAG: hypothetical protein R3B13_37790 [Polyangiaceae bacterium]